MRETAKILADLANGFGKFFDRKEFSSGGQFSSRGQSSLKITTGGKQDTQKAFFSLSQMKYLYSPFTSSFKDLPADKKKLFAQSFAIFIASNALLFVFHLLYPAHLELSIKKYQNEEITNSDFFYLLFYFVAQRFLSGISRLCTERMHNINYAHQSAELVEKLPEMERKFRSGDQVFASIFSTAERNSKQTFENMRLLYSCIITALAGTMRLHDNATPFFLFISLVLAFAYYKLNYYVNKKIADLTMPKDLALINYNTILLKYLTGQIESIASDDNKNVIEKMRKSAPISGLQTVIQSIDAKGLVMLFLILVLLLFKQKLEIGIEFITLMLAMNSEASSLFIANSQLEIFQSDHEKNLEKLKNSNFRGSSNYTECISPSAGLYYLPSSCKMLINSPNPKRTIDENTKLNKKVIGEEAKKFIAAKYPNIYNKILQNRCDLERDEERLCVIISALFYKDPEPTCLVFSGLSEIIMSQEPLQSLMLSNSKKNLIIVNGPSYLRAANAENNVPECFTIIKNPGREMRKSDSEDSIYRGSPWCGTAFSRASSDFDEPNNRSDGSLQGTAGAILRR